MVPDSRVVLALSMQICCVGLLVQSLELLWNWRHLRDEHLLGWGPGSDSPVNPLVRFIRWTHGFPACLYILGWRALAAAVCLFWPDRSGMVFWLLGTLFVSQLYFNRRFSMLRESAGTMFLICLGAAVAGYFPEASDRLVSASLVFLAFQALLAYFAAGRAKLTSAFFRYSAYLARVFEVHGQTFAWVGESLNASPKAARLLAWSIITLELLFPFSIVLPSPGFWLFIVGGLVFHAAVTVLMGANAFLWSFVSTYPALWFVHEKLRGH
jgi:hypothetical protein